MDRPIITISEGKIQGTTLKSVFGKKYLAFRGIPYAQPPLDNLRFREPQPPLKWQGIRDASNFAATIPTQKGIIDQEFLEVVAATIPTQKGIINQEFLEVIGGEDCLYLNVYANAIGHKRPVMFWIHGGIFMFGDANYPADYLVNTDVVLVHVNYRLGPLGFLSVGHEVSSGNQGLRDLIMALQWVQRNIEAFGGDPNNVTIFGHSSGSMICHIFTMIPSTKHLFQKAILQSGASYISKNLITGKDPKNGFRIASLLGMESDDPEEVVKFLRTVRAEKLVDLENHIYSKWEILVLGRRIYAPIVDGDISKDPVIPLTLDKLYQNDAEIPIIIGHTTDESLLSFLGKFDKKDTYKFNNDNIEDIIKHKLELKDQTKFPEVMNFIQEFYLKNQPINEDTMWNLIHLLSDLQINLNRKIIDARNQYPVARTYVYNFSYLGNQTTIYQFDQGPQPLEGVAHADELSYMFYFDYMKKDQDEKDRCPEVGSKDRDVIERMIRMWYNFAETGNPTPVTDDKYITAIWKPTSKENLHYLDIGDELTLKYDRDSVGRMLYEKIKNDFFFGI